MDYISEPVLDKSNSLMRELSALDVNADLLYRPISTLSFAEKMATKTITIQ